MIFIINNIATGLKTYNSRKLKCPFCTKTFKIDNTLYSHIELDHKDKLSDDISAKHYVYDLKHPGDHLCQICKVNKCVWKEKTGRYSTICDDPVCREEARRRFLKNYKNKHGKDYSIDDPEVQREMLKRRKNSGEYKFSDGGKVSFASSYEEDFLKFCDLTMEFSSDFIQECHINFLYEYEGKTHYYLPDYYIKEYDLIIEIKADNELSHPKLLAIDKETEKLKDEAIKKDGTHNFIKICDKNYDDFIKLIDILKNNYLNTNTTNLEDKYIIIPEYKDNEIKGFKMPNLNFISDSNLLISDKMEYFYLNNNKRNIRLELVIDKNYLPKELKDNELFREEMSDQIICRSSEFDYKDKTKFDRTFKEFTKYYTKKCEPFINQKYMTVRTIINTNNFRCIEIKYIDDIFDINKNLDDDEFDINEINKIIFDTFDNTIFIRSKLSLFIVYKKDTKNIGNINLLLKYLKNKYKNNKTIIIKESVEYFIPLGINDGGVPVKEVPNEIINKLIVEMNK